DALEVERQHALHQEPCANGQHLAGNVLVLHAGQDGGLAVGGVALVAELAHRFRPFLFGLAGRFLLLFRAHVFPARCFMTFSIIRCPAYPCMDSTDSGWNCTAHIGSVLWQSAMMTSLSLTAMM